LPTSASACPASCRRREQHYHRVRAVYALYGPQVDSETKLPLFNTAAWDRANNVLAEILAGHVADPPGVQFYFQSLNTKGEPMFDEHGLPLLDCNRGTNDVENSHKQLLATFGSWCTGAEMVDCLLAERRHRYNVSEHKWRGFPKTGHNDTWIIDHWQAAAAGGREPQRAHLQSFIDFKLHYFKHITRRFLKN
jgi:hypothetical protein